MEKEILTTAQRFFIPSTTSPVKGSPLRGMAFLVGGIWVGTTGQNPTEVVTETFSWMLNGHYIGSRQTTGACDGSSAGLKSGLVGVDSRTGKLVQWIFTSDGAYAVLVGEETPKNVWISVGDLTAGGTAIRIRSTLTKLNINHLVAELEVRSGDQWIKVNELELTRSPLVE